MISSSLNVFSTTVTAKERTKLGKQSGAGGGKNYVGQRRAETPGARKKGL